MYCFLKGLTIRTIAYIDGQNFLYKIAERLTTSKLVSDKQEVTKLDIPFLLQQSFPDQSPQIRYYSVTRIRQQNGYGPEVRDKSIAYADNLRRLRSFLISTGVIFKPTGVLRLYGRDICKSCGAIGYKFQEKGVDVSLAVDLVSDTLLDKVDHIILASSDTDLIPALRIIQSTSKQLTYLSFENQCTQAISRIANQTKVIRDQDVIEAYLRTFN